jgi:hypothetical protein
MMPWQTTHFSVSLFRNPRICQLGKQLPLWAMLGDGDPRLVRKYHSLNDFRDMWPHA